MTDGAPAQLFTFEQIAAAAQRTRFGLIALAGHGWFSAREAADVIGVARGTIREHTPLLVSLRLLDEREVPGRPLPSRVWHVTSTGGALHNELARLVGQPPASEEPLPSLEPAALIAVRLTDSRGPELLDALLADPRTRTASVPGFWLESQE